MAIIIPSRPSESTRVASVSRSTDAIRSRLLFKLGITDASIYHKMRCADEKKKRMSAGAAGGGGNTKKGSLPRQLQQSSRLQALTSHDCKASPVVRKLVPLKFGPEPPQAQGGCNRPHLITSNSSFSEDDTDSSEPPASIDGSSISTSSTKSTTNSSSSSSKSASFDPSVTVIPVPSHRSYSPRMHAQLYTPRDTMASDMMRNTREFIHEDWNWQNVIEEDGMYTCKKSGELVHPAHVSFTSKKVNPYR